MIEFQHYILGYLLRTKNGHGERFHESSRAGSR